MMIRTVLIILLFTFSVTSGLEVTGPDNDRHASSGSTFSQTYPSCFKEDTTWSTTESTMIPGVEDPYTCQSSCQESATCHQFTWYNQQAFPLNLACFLYDHPTQEYPCTNCVSGPQFCTTSTTILSTTSPTITTTTTSDCSVPEPQKHGDWFCPPSSEVPTCHLECHPGYVSDNGTVMTCQHGEWSSAPTCVAAVALITGNSDSPSNTVEVYSEGLHLQLPDLPGDEFLHSLDLVDSSVLLCGGRFTPSSCLVLTSSQHWVPHSTTTSPRSYHSSISALGQLHLLGGYYSRPLSTSEHLARSSTTWSEGWQLLEPSYDACSSKVGPELAILTGGSNHRSSVISYNVTSGAASRLQNLISPRYHHGCCYVRDEGFRGVLVAGGNGGDRGFSQIYDINTGEWATTGTLTTERYDGVRMFVIGEQILASGGRNGVRTISTVDRFNLTSRTWKPAENMLEGRSSHAVTAVPPSLIGIASD